MKIHKASLICSLIIGLAISAAAIDPSEGDRPERVRASNWIRISDTAGIVVSNRSGEKVVGTLYIKHDEA
jgi:hypothetical protein